MPPLVSLSAGARLGPYEVVSLLGSGGMGEVYRARDTRLERTVAIKILPETLSGDPQFRERFDREARAISQLDHPNICTLYDVGEQAGVAYLVMQLLDGETLENRLKKGALPLDQALKTAIEVASALDKAHRAGIVHRDLKPGNIMLTKTGAKLLDFGLAKSSAPVVAGAGLSMLPTTPANLTAQGTILGTFQYMAPEQLEGQEADARTDIFAFGSVVYEMLTGKKAFEGKSQASLIAAIIHVDPPPIAASQSLAPPTLDRVVKKCLAKEPDRRWQSASDLSDELRWIVEASSQGGLPAPAVLPGQAGVRTGLTRMTGLAAAVLVGAAVALTATLYLRRAPADLHVYRSAILTPTNLAANTIPSGRLALSPDGRRLAFIAADANSGAVVLWVRPLDGLTAQPLAGTQGAVAPFWSPDSRFIAFIAGGKLKKIDAGGGPVLTLCDAPRPFEGTWNGDDVLIFSGPGGTLARVTASGGTPIPVTALDTKAGEVSHVSPSFLPDGRHFLYIAQTTAGTGGLYVGSLDSKDRTRLLDLNTSIRYADGYVLLIQDSTLMARPFDARRFAFTGDAVPVAERIGAGGGTGVFSASQTGVLVFQEAGTAAGDTRLAWFDRNGAQVAVLGEPGSYGHVELAPDGERVAVSLLDPGQNGNRDIWLLDVARGIRTRFTFDPANDFFPIWSPDGARVVFASSRKGTADLYQKASNGTGPDAVLLADSPAEIPRSWSSDGRFILYTVANAPGDRGNAGVGNPNQTDLWVLPLFGDRTPMPFLQTPFTETNGRFAPDGKWIAYQSNESGRPEVYVAPFNGPGGKWQVSTMGGTFPRWSRDGKEVFYLAADNKLMATAVVAKGTGFEVGAVRPLFQARPAGGLGYPYDVSPDGRRILVNTVAEQTSAVVPITLVVNWTAGLKK